MMIRETVNDEQLETMRFAGSEDTFLIPAGERLATSLVTYVSGISSPVPSQPMALTLLEDWLCLSDKLGECYTYSLWNIKGVNVVELPQFSTSVAAPDGLEQQVLRPSSLALAIRIPTAVWEFDLLLAVYHSSHAYEWLRLITQARIVVTSLSRDEFDAGGGR